MVAVLGCGCLVERLPGAVPELVGLRLGDRPCLVGVEAAVRVGLGAGEFLPVESVGVEFDCQHPGTEGLAAGEVFAGAEDQPARRLSGPERRI